MNLLISILNNYSITLIIVIGFILFFIIIHCILSLFDIFSNKTYIGININQNKVNIEKKGIYSIGLIGAGYVYNNCNFYVTLSNEKESINSTNILIKPRFIFLDQLSIEICKFKFLEKGIYYIQFNNLEELQVKKSILFSKRIFETNYSFNEFNFVLIESTKTNKLINYLLLLFFSLLILLMLIFLLFYF